MSSDAGREMRSSSDRSPLGEDERRSSRRRTLPPWYWRWLWVSLSILFLGLFLLSVLPWSQPTEVLLVIITTAGALSTLVGAVTGLITACIGLINASRKLRDTWRSAT